MSTSSDQQTDAGSARRFLALLGVLFAALAVACAVFPSWNVPSHAMPVCAALGTGLIVVARCVPDTWVRRIENLFLGWP